MPTQGYRFESAARPQVRGDAERAIVSCQKPTANANAAVVRKNAAHQ
jgi:hypothetical protein